MGNEPDRVFRGGTCYNGASYAQLANRYWLDPCTRNVDIGVRLVRVTNILHQIAEVSNGLHQIAEVSNGK